MVVTNSCINYHLMMTTEHDHGYYNENDDDAILYDGVDAGDCNDADATTTDANTISYFKKAKRFVQNRMMMTMVMMKNKQHQYYHYHNHNNIIRINCIHNV